MAFPLVLAGVDKDTIKSKVDEAAEMLELTEHLDRKPANLSGGQRQRVAMGRAIVRSPKAFLMDEPLSNLDAKLRVQMRTQVARIQKTLATTTLYVTHDQTEAMTLGDRVVVMRGGIVQQVGSPTELYQRPSNLFVAGFIGSPSMNFLPATIEGGNLNCGLGTIEMPDQIRQAAERGKGREVIIGIRPEHFEDAALVGDAPGSTVHRADRPGRVDGLRHLRLLHRPRRRRTPATSTTWPRTPARTCTARAPRSWHGSTLRPTRGRARRPSSGWTPPRCSVFDGETGANLTNEQAGAHAGA